MTREHYESTEAVETANGWYTLYKEKSFLDYIFAIESVQRHGLLVEVGGGTGFHGGILAQCIEGLYVHSDYSYAMCYAARKKGLITIQSDGLTLPMNDESVDGIFTVGASTIVRSAETRILQFKEFLRLLKPGGNVTMVTGWPGNSDQHCIDLDDVEALLKLGFIEPEVRFWGVIPGRWWGAGSCRTFGWIEKAMSWGGIGARKIVVLNKRGKSTKDSDARSN
jgi:SAM-dependent methyltransferase